MRERVEGHLPGGATWRLATVANRARIVAKDFADARDRRRSATTGLSVAERRAEIVTFYERFERFVETICDAAQYGPTSRLEALYSQDRAWVADHYEALRPYLGAYLPPDEPEAFDRLLMAEDLRTFLSSDDGAVILRITNAREALSHYAEHLRQLAARTGG